MVVRLRLARHHWTRNQPKYNIVAINSSDRPTAQPIEVLGEYDPIPRPHLARPTSPNGQPRGPEWGPPQAGALERIESAKKRVEWNEDRVKYWLSVGAKPTRTVERLLNLGGVIESEWRPLPTRMNKMQLSKDERIRRAVRQAQPTWSPASSP